MALSEEERKRRGRESTQRYREKNRDRLNAEDRERRKTDFEYAEKRRQNCRDWLKANPEHRREYKAKWSKQNPESVLATKRKGKLGISKEDQERLFEKQGGRCAICDIEITFLKGHLDHCHETDQIREFLCRNCNLMIGIAQDSIPVLENAIEYLEKHRGGQPLSAVSYETAIAQEGVVFEEDPNAACTNGLCGS